MELIDYIRAVRAHWLGVVLLVTLSVSAAGIFTLAQDNVYAADASGRVRVGDATDAATASVNDGLAKSKAVSYVEVATSRPVAELVIDDLDLAVDPSSIITDITVTQPENTASIQIKAEAGSPEAARELADAWVRALATRVATLEAPLEPTEDDGGRRNEDVPVATAPFIIVQPNEFAALPSAPISPRPLLNLALGGVLGLLVGLGYAVARSIVDRRLRSPEAAERAFGVSIVGRIPVTKGNDGKRGITVSDGAAGGDAGNWGTGEAFRKLRTNLSYMNVDAPPRIIVVTSPKPRDGKSTTAANLAAAIALSGQQVTLVDGDLRRPTVAETLGLVEGAGLTDVLIGRVELEDVLQQHDTLPQLSVLAAGSTPPNPSELLGSHVMQKLLAELSLSGMVIIDAPPLLPVTDGAVLTRHSDGALVVVSHGSTLDTELAESLRQLEAVSGTVLGVVFNRMPRRNSDGYGSSYYGYQAAPSTSEVKAVVPKPAAPKSGGGKRAAR